MELAKDSKVKSASQPQFGTDIKYDRSKVSDISFCKDNQDNFIYPEKSKEKLPLSSAASKVVPGTQTQKQMFAELNSSL